MNEIKRTLKDSAVARWSALVFISLVMFATYYYYDVFSTIKTTLQAEVGLTNSEYGTWYGMYSLTNAVLLMAFLGGIILDKWGIRKTSLLFFSFMIIGAAGTAFGASVYFKEGAFSYGFFASFLKGYSPQLKLMILGRIIFGLGGETLYVCINKIIAKWFKGKELALAFSINLAFGRFGTAAALMIAPRLVSAGYATTGAGWFGVMLMFSGILTLSAFTIFDVKYNKQLGKLKPGEEKAESEGVNLKEIFQLLTNRAFIYISFLCLTFYSAVFPFLAFAADFLSNKFGFPEKLSGDLVSILPFGTVVFTPIFGWICDNKGKSASLMVLGSLLLIAVHLSFAFTSVSPYILLFLLGVAFSLVPAAMWPSVANIIDAKKLGTAYGTMFTIQNWGLMLIPFLMGRLLDKSNPGITAEMVKAGEATYNYTSSILILVVLGFLGLTFAFLLKRENKKTGIGLEQPNKQQ